MASQSKPLPDWDAITLRDRLVFVCVDSDVMVKDEVRKALARLTTFLKSLHSRPLCVPGRGAMGPPWLSLTSAESSGGEPRQPSSPSWSERVDARRGAPG